MKKMIFALAVLLGLAGKAQAQIQNFVQMSSVTTCSVSITSYTAVRVDNFNGACGGVMKSRNEVEVCVQTGGAAVNCGFSSSVSTQPSSAFIGKEVTAGPTNCMKEWLPSFIQFWCFGQSMSAAQNVYVKQGAPSKQFNWAHNF
jgi:hypothetical protein